MKRLLLTATLYASLILPAQAATVSLITPTLRPGDAFIAAFDEQPTRVTFGEEALVAFPYRTGWRVVTAVPLSEKAGTKKLVTEFKSGSVTKSVVLTPRKQLVINLPVPEKMHQTPQQLVQSLATTNQTVSKSTQVVTSDTKFSAPFALPLMNNRKISSPFGEVRKTHSAGSANSLQAGSGQAGSERITHLGVDFDQPKGSIVAAINAGVVAKAYLDSTYGNSVYVDHGRGIFTLYLHLDSMRVKVGDAVKKGTIVGTLGETGLASGPHLHLSIKINGTSVDPLQFVQNFR